MLHITIMTNKLDESVAFYQRVADLKILRDNRGSDHPIVFLVDADKTVSVELAGNPRAAYSGEGISLGFEVDDATAKRAKLLNDGFAPGPILSPDPHAQFFFMDDPNGVSLQFVHEE